MKINNSKINYHHGTVSGNNICIGNSGTLDFGWKIRGGHYQKQTIQNDNLLILEDTTITKNGITLTIKDGVITIDGTSTASTNIDFKIKKKLKAGTYRHKVQRDSGSASGNIGFLIMSGDKSIHTLNTGGGSSFTLEEDTDAFYRIWTDKNNTISNMVYKCIISETDEAKTWVQGIPDSPSVDYPSKIETVKDSVKINVSNENLFNEQYIQGYFVNDSGKTNTSAEGARADDYIPVSDNKTIYVLFKCLKSCTLARFWLMEFDENYNVIKRTTTGIYDTSFNIGNTIKQLNLSQKCRYIKPSFYSLRDGGASLTYDKFNEYFNISISRNQTEEYIKHQSQTAIMPIQQEMLEGDYVADVEHHEWKKLELTGEEEWFSNINTGWTQNEHIFGFSFSGIKTNGQTTNVGKVLICNYFECDNTTVLVDVPKNLISYYPFLREGSILINHQGISTLTDFKAWLKAKYDAGNPVIVYYKLAEAINLELTTEQKAVREQKLCTYKNITNIDVSDELASIDVEYKKDIETEHNKLQNEIDEIKQLISTTETSALLLDNLQKDVESEVE